MCSVYPAARREPVSAMPRAAPTSRVVSLTADATPCLPSGTDVMMAEVVGAVNIPTPVLTTSSGHARAQYDESMRTRHRDSRPADSSPRPMSTTRRNPSFGRYHDDSGDRMSIGTASGDRASAVPSGL